MRLSNSWLAAIVAAFALLSGCDLPPGIDTLDPGEGDPVPPGTAEVNPPPTDEAWNTDTLAWQPGGETACAGTPPPGTGGPGGGGPVTGGGPGGGGPGGRADPFVVELWDGLGDACGETPDSGDRSIRLSLSDRVPGTFTVGTVCTGPLSAGGVYRRFLGSQEERRAAVGGTVTVTAVSSDGVVDGVFSVRFEGDEVDTSGGFRAELGCVSPGR